MNISKFLLFLFLTVAWPLNANALYTLQTTLSGGYYRDVGQKTHFPAFFYWTLNHSTTKNIETTVDMGINNTLVPETWRMRVYQAFVSIPLARDSNLPQYRQPQLWLGRQFLTEGFELAPMDGFQLPYAFSKVVGVTFYGGMLRNLEDEKLSLDARAAGASVFGEVSKYRYRAGFLHKENSSAKSNFAHGTVLKEWKLPWTPSTLAKAQWELSQTRLDQAVAELQLHPSDKLMASLEYSSRQPRSLDVGNTLFIYRLFSISTQEQLATRLSWKLSSDLRLETGVQRMSYKSVAGPETSFQEDLGLTYQLDRDTWSPGFVHLKSYGGDLYQLGVRYVHVMSTLTKIHAEGNVARIDKLNGIASWAYHGRGGVGFQLGSRFLALLLIEGERNHIFKFDARAVAYVSHFLY